MLLQSGMPNMRFEHICLLVMASIGFGSTSIALSTAHVPISERALAINPPTTDLAQGTDSTTRGVSTVLSCFAKRLYSRDGQWDACYEAFLSFWNSTGDDRDNRIGERKKDWNEQIFIMGAGFKLILLLPIFAILAGKSILLSLVSLLITSMAFLHKSSNDHTLK